MRILSSLAPSSIASRTYDSGGRFSRPVKNDLNSRSQSGEEMHLQSTLQSWKASACLCADCRFQWRLFGGFIEQMHPVFPASSSPTSSDRRTIGSKTNPRRQHATDSTDWTLSERSDVALARNTMLAGGRKAASAGTRSGKTGWEKAASEQRLGVVRVGAARNHETRFEHIPPQATHVKLLRGTIPCSEAASSQPVVPAAFEPCNTRRKRDHNTSPGAARPEWQG